MRGHSVLTRYLNESLGRELEIYILASVTEKSGKAYLEIDQVANYFSEM
jgi:hypothetical protein